MNTTQYHNSPLRSCETCAYRKKDGFWGDQCGRSGYSCEVERQFAHWSAQCDPNFSGWRPRPPRRSLRRWLLEVFWE